MENIRFSNLSELENILVENNYPDLFMDLRSYVNIKSRVGITPDNKSAIVLTNDILYLFSMSTDKVSIDLLEHYVENLLYGCHIDSIEMNNEAVDIIKRVNERMKKGSNRFIIQCVMSKDCVSSSIVSNDIKKLDFDDLSDIVENLKSYLNLNDKRLKGYGTRLLTEYDVYGLFKDGILVSQLYVVCNKDIATLCGVCTRTEYRNKGYATELVDSVSNMLLQNKYNKVLVQVYPTNEYAMKLYMNAGFVNKLSYQEYLI